MDFKLEEENLLLELVKLRGALSQAKTKQEEMSLKIHISMLTGVSLWLMTNAVNISNLSDFKERIDSLGKVLNHSTYKLMNDSLCISCSINNYLGQDISSSELKDILRVEELPTDEDLLEISKAKYEQSSKCYEELKSTPEFFDYVSLCGYTMNFQLDGDYQEAEDSFITVNSFYGVFDELEKIYQQKKVFGKDTKKHKGNPKK